jgi:hypothetical protein
MLWAGQEQDDEEFVARLLDARAVSEPLLRGRAHYGAAPCESPQVFTVLRVHGQETVLGALNAGPHRHTVTLRLPIDELTLPHDAYHLADLLRGARWREDGRDTWSRGELASIRLTLEPYGAYCLALQPAEAPATTLPLAESHSAYP